MVRKSTRVLTKVLEKRGIDDIKELAPEERAIFDKWRLILRGDSVTIDSLKDFCTAQIRIIEGKCDGINPLTILQQASIHVYVNLLKAIEAPEAERASLEKYLTQIVNS